MKSTHILILGAAAVTTLLVGCGIRKVEREVVVVDGERFLCSHTENRISGNERDPQCVAIGDAVETTVP